MQRFLAAFVLVGGLFRLCTAAHAQTDDPPHWIWLSEQRQPPPTADNDRRPIELTRSFSLAGRPQSAALQLANDSCAVVVELNGQQVLTIEDHSPTVRIDVTDSVRSGENRIAVRGTRTVGPVAVALSLDVQDESGRSTSVVSDTRWSASVAVQALRQPEPAASFGTVAPEMWGLGRRAATIDEFDNYEQWRQATGAEAVSDTGRFWTAPGFDIELLRVAQPDEGSWVSLAFDPPGRITIAREDRGLLRLSLDDARSITHVETINDELLECRGLLYAHGALYANANNSKALYRLRDTDGDDRFDEVTLLREFSGGVGHGRNDLALGPDGNLYSIHGDAVDVPTSDIRDHMSPFREARRGRKTSEGYLVRAKVERNSFRSSGSPGTAHGERNEFRSTLEWELICSGLRNPFGIDFNAHGDAFTYDADAEFDMGTPWYRPTRVVQLVSGADYGWRGVTGTWPPYVPDHPDNALPSLDIGKGSPTAVLFGTKSQFPSPYRDALFILDWAYGRILAVHLTPRGAGYRAHAETFLKGRPLNVTDLAFGPDGAMYIVTGGRKTQAALYRIAYTGPQIAAPPLTAQQQACADHAAVARAARQTLESFHRPDQPDAVATAWPYLNSPDPLLRHAARIAVEHQPPETWRNRALAVTDPTACLTALLALARSGEPSACEPVVARLLELTFNKLDVGQKLALLHTYALCLEHAPGSVEKQRDAVIGQLASAFPDASGGSAHISPYGTGDHVNRELSRLLVRLGAPSVVEKSMALLAASRGQEDQLHYLFVLRGTRDGWTPELRRAYFTALNDTSRFLGGDGMPGFLARIREEAVATLTAAEREELAALLQPAPEPDLVPPQRPVVNEWKLGDFIAALAEPVHKPDLARGHTVFRDALCVRCHRVGARGPAVGPDLTFVGRRFSRRDILESILAPANVIAENYRNLEVVTRGGRVIVGRTLVEGDYRSQELRIATNPLKPSEVVVLHKSDIEERRFSDTSPMPSGLLNTFTSDEILDLLAYLEAGAASAHDPPTEEGERR